jgi:hypothetical protein
MNHPLYDLKHRAYATTIFRAIAVLETLLDYQADNNVEIVANSDTARLQRDLKPTGEFHDNMRHVEDK